MKHKYFFYLLISILFVSTRITNIYAETEPNNTPEQANPLALNGSDAGTLGDNDDVDWWKVTIPSDGKLIVATLSDAALEIDNYIYDQDKTTQIASYAYGGSHTWDTTYFNNLLAGTYYIKTSRWSGGGAYTITNHFIPTNYQNDPEINDSAQVAVTLNMNGSATGHLGYYSQGYADVNDWWKVTVPSDGKLVIATQSDPTLEIDNYIYDKDKKSQIASYAYGGVHTWDTTYFVNLVPGTYYILSYRYGGYGAYTISNNFTPANYQNDPEINDSAEVAGNLSLNGSSTGHLGFYSLGYTDIYDWWKITVPSDGKLVVATQSDPTIEIDNYIYDQDRTTQIASYAYGGSHTWDTTYFNNLVPGTYYVLSFRYGGYGSYSIANNFIPAGLGNDPEPNDSIPVAKNITVNTLSTGHLGYYDRGNVDRNDYFAFTVTSVWDTLFIRTDSSPTLELDLYLYNSAQEWISSSGAYGTTELLIFTNLQPGTYYVNAYDYGGYGSYGLIITNVRPNSPLVSVENKTVDLIPDEFDLKQNYPNPFNPSTTIEFSLPQSGFVTLKVYNNLGEEVSTLKSGYFSAGNYKTLWNAAGLPSGIYFYQLRAEKFVQTKKLILMK
jgi:hypothetical protein